MEKYYIHESNIERLEKQITAIKNKCIKNDVSFTYKLGDPVYRNIAGKDEPENLQKFYEVTVEGSIKHDNWIFAATVQHVAEGTNIVRAYETELTVPSKYYTCGPTCEHCNKIRSRKDTYLIYNTETQEFKQVGKSCLKEYTQGLDAEEVARYISLFDTMIKGEAPTGSGLKPYKSVRELLQYSFECVKHFGYHNSESKYSTRSRVFDYMWASRSSCPETLRNKVKAEQEEVGFNLNSEDTLKNIDDALEWIRNAKDDYGYISNLKAACLDDYTEARNSGLVISLSQAYLRHINDLAEQKKAEERKRTQAELDAFSEYVGEVGQRITFVPADAAHVSTFENLYGLVWLYRFTDDNNNVYIWYSSNPLEEDREIVSVTGTVKSHSEYRDVKQTVLTRCKIVYSEKERAEEIHPESKVSEVEQAVADFIDYVNR